MDDAATAELPDLPRISPVPLPTSAADLPSWLERDAQTELERERVAKNDDALGRLIARQDALIASEAANADRALAILNEFMQPVMDIARCIVARLNGCTTAAAIVASGDPDVLAAWSDLRALRADEYNSIRTAESWIRAGDPRVLNYRSNWLYDDDVATDFTASNMDARFEQWKQLKPQFAIISTSDQPQADPRPYPPDETAQLVWFVTADVRVWVPTWAQLGELSRQRLQDRAHTGGKQPQRRGQKLLNQTPGNATSELLNEQLEVATA